MELTIQAKDRKYSVILEKEAIRHLEKVLPDNADRIIVFADQHVWNLHSSYFQQHVSVAFDKYLLKSGEATKTLAEYDRALAYLLESNASRKTVLIAFGGGAVGDFTGFVAATYMRGIPFIQLPTTILAHDSAVGGKTGINHTLGKNMIGAFHQPLAVIFDTHFLQTLPNSEIRSGYTELIKHAFLSDPVWAQELLQLKSMDDIKALNWQEQLAKGIAVKAAIVEKDEFETYERKFLNLGHTYGHGIEALAGYGRLKHGEAVGIGLVITFLISEQHDLAKTWLRQMLALGYPTNEVLSFPFESIMEFIRKDKKNTATELQFVVLSEISKPALATVTEEQVHYAHTQLCAWLKEDQL